MKEYTLINPSDPYTFLAEDKEVATLVVLSLNPGYGAETKDRSESVPIFAFSTEEKMREWYETEFSRTIEEGLKAKRKEIGEALLTFMYGGFEDRRRYQAALSAITDEEKKKKFMEEWQDGHSSFNNIGAYAHNLGRNILKTITN